MPEKKPKKRNFIETFLHKRKIQQKRKKFFGLEINQGKYKSFLKEMDKALESVFKEVPDSSLLLDRMGEETARWMDDMPFINIASFKAGTCYGIYTYCKLKAAQELRTKEPYVV